jgi:hypothetical protein
LAKSASSVIYGDRKINGRGRDDMALVKILEKSDIHYGCSDIPMTVQCQIGVTVEEKEGFLFLDEK